MVSPIQRKPEHIIFSDVSAYAGSGFIDESILKVAHSMFTEDEKLKKFYLSRTEDTISRNDGYFAHLLRWRRRDVCNFHMIYIEDNFYNCMHINCRN